MKSNGLPDYFGWSNVPRFGGSQPSGSTTTTQNTSPWAGQSPYLTGTTNVGAGSPVSAPGGAYSTGNTGLFPSAEALYEDQSKWPSYYPGSTYAPLNSMQNQDISALINMGTNGGNTGLQSANSSVSGMLSPGYTAQTQQGMNTAQNGLEATASGAYTNPFTSPGFQNVINGTLASVIPATSASFINGGRSDSGLATAAQTAAATNAIGQIANQNYTTEQGLQQGAQNTLSNNFLTQQGNQVKASAIAPTIDQQQTSDMTTGLNAAGMTQQEVQDQLNAGIGAWNYNQALPYNMLGMFQNYTGGNYGGSTSTQTPYFQNTGANVLGGATGALGIGNSLFGSQGLLGSVVGGTGIFSDRRLKTDIKEIGESDSGFPLYSFRYKADPAQLHVGLMAQDVMKDRPDAVIHTPFGMAVDYAKALAA